MGNSDDGERRRGRHEPAPVKSLDPIRGQRADVGPFEHLDPLVVAQLHCDLAEAGIDSGDVLGACLQERFHDFCFSYVGFVNFNWS